MKISKPQLTGPDVLAKIKEGVTLVINNGKYLSVTLWGSPRADVECVRVTKRVYGPKQTFEGELLIKIGEPNYRERGFLRACKKTHSKPDWFWVNKMRREKQQKRGLQAHNS